MSERSTFEKLAIDDVDTDGEPLEPEHRQLLSPPRVAIEMGFVGGALYIHAELRVGGGGGGGADEPGVELQLNYIDGNVLASAYKKPDAAQSAWHRRRHMRLYLLLLRRTLQVWRSFFGFPAGNVSLYVRVPTIGDTGLELESQLLRLGFRHERNLRQPADFFRMISTTDQIC